MILHQLDEDFFESLGAFEQQKDLPADLGGVMGELASALAGLAAEGLHVMCSAELLERTAELVGARNRIDAELARTVRRAELAQAPDHDGLKSMASWLRGHARLSPAVAGQLVPTGFGATLSAARARWRPVTAL
jgi:hypothetical protein